MSKITYLVLCASLLSHECFADVRGKIIDAKTQEAIEYATIKVLDVKSHVVLPFGLAQTDSLGSFKIDSLANGNYILLASMTGYKQVERNFKVVNNKANIGTISLQEALVKLKEVSVKGKRPQMTFEADKRVFNVADNASTAGGSASDVLEQVPSVEVDNEGDISLRGNSSVEIWINGKASGLTADNRAQILEQIPAENIEKIEVVTNPSSKYSAEGTAGIINIVLKRNLKAGYYGGAQAGADSRGGFNGSFNFNYNSSLWELSASVGYRKNIRYRSANSFREDDSGITLSQNQKTNGYNSNLFTRLGAVYKATTKDNISFTFFGTFGGRKNNATNYYDTNNPATYLYSTRYSHDKNDMLGGNASIGYSHIFGEEHKIDFSATYNQWNTKTRSEYSQESYYPDGIRSNEPQLQKGKIRPHNVELQLDYVNRFSNLLKFESGYKTTISRENSPSEMWEGNPLVLNEDLYNIFKYNQDVHAIYANASGKINKFSYQLGLRGEYSYINTISLGYQESENDVQRVKKNYFRLFPSMFLSYSLPHGNEIQLNYSRRIKRPWGRQLNSFQNVSDSTNINVGNPNLNPEYSNLAELNYIKSWTDHTLSFSAYLNRTNDVIQHISYLNSQVLYVTNENVANSTSVGLSIVGKDRLFSSLIDVTTTLDFYYYKLSDYTIYEVKYDGEEQMSWNAKMLLAINLPKSYSLQITGSYNSRKAIAQGTRKAYWQLDAGVRKKWKNITLAISGKDLLESRSFRGIVRGNGFVRSSNTYWGGRRVGFTLTYNFGNTKPKKTSLPKSSETGNGYEDAEE